MLSSASGALCTLGLFDLTCAISYLPQVAPCECRGDTRYVHLNCLQKWHTTTSENKVGTQTGNSILGDGVENTTLRLCDGTDFHYAIELFLPCLAPPCVFRGMGALAACCPTVASLYLVSNTALLSRHTLTVYILWRLNNQSGTELSCRSFYYSQGTCRRRLQRKLSVVVQYLAERPYWLALFMVLMAYFGSAKRTL